ncbi:Prolipoprotein diacylglyceryl transferase [Mariprofundus ferrinatatus]|uniref:Phosphatidylglycerol--prolipoprotein diacylglyceryl transferase n=2 Tax=Mariprofundus ferrinatatus TaxID=1921087 RepID=A0A2K8L0W5_9PROT|nr:prolipoprotein diacylglyceryl transferase [Mariprofundus ferrinatatus]ATX80955.1 Prolipoprotein diacylglyceryl transferase [Mariprofundus ferrinatatus]
MVWSGIDPVALQLGPVAIHWYGLMYIAGFFATWYLVRLQLKQAGLWETRVSNEAYEGLFTTLILGVILGGRIAYVLFYNFGYYIDHPLEALYIWQGGMSFHGGMIGPLVTGWWYCRKHDLPFLELADRFFTVAPLGLMFGRIGNFINGELWGRTTDVPWGMVFPHAGPDPRHPSQLYEMALEGLLLFIILWLVRKQVWPAGARVAIFLTGYAVARIFCENFREPDEQLGFLFGSVTMGMLLSSAMLIVGLAWLARLWLGRRGEPFSGG